MYSFSVIIVSWNALDLLKRFLPGVAQTEYPDFEVLLADNASTDGSADWVRENWPQVRIVTLDRNYGYCGGNNRGARKANGDLLVFLNNDVQVEPDWLSKLNECFQAHPDAAALQPKMRSCDNPAYFEYAGAAGGFLDRYGYPFCRGRLFDTLEEDLGQYDDASELLWASGAALAIRKEQFEELGGFDEDFEFHMEEIDLCWQLWNRGHKVRFCPDSIVYHLGGGSMPMHSPRKVYYNYRNNLVMLLKNYTNRSLWRRLPVRILLDFLAGFRLMVMGGWEEFKALCQAYLDFIRRIPGVLRKRKQLQMERTVHSEPRPLLPVSIVWYYFVRNRTTFSEIVD
ncbi:MAG: glycosyltransferase family 2 protein [Balneolaceae bacterium]|nr:glycosyltransferase family 2 protein [Balneolaceae bacterium]